MKIQCRRSGRCHDLELFFFSLIHTYNLRIWAFSRHPTFPEFSSPVFLLLYLFVCLFVSYSLLIWSMPPLYLWVLLLSSSWFILHLRLSMDFLVGLLDFSASFHSAWVLFSVSIFFLKSLSNPGFSSLLMFMFGRHSGMNSLYVLSPWFLCTLFKSGILWWSLWLLF